MTVKLFHAELSYVHVTLFWKRFALPVACNYSRRRLNNAVGRYDN